jgi:hypothetical protein
LLPQENITKTTARNIAAYKANIKDLYCSPYSTAGVAANTEAKVNATLSHHRQTVDERNSDEVSIGKLIL